MQISKITFEQCLKNGEHDFAMHYDDSDCLRIVKNADHFNEVRSILMQKYGDVDVTIVLDGFWGDRITINDDKWRNDHRHYVDVKQAWCDKYGCD